MPSVHLGGGPTPRIDVRKTYKLYIGGAFPRTESGRTYVVSTPAGEPLANACRASKKDLRDAVRAARKAFEPWAARSAMNRGQVLYRVAELMEGRRDQFGAEVAAGEGLSARSRPRGGRPRRSIAGSGTPAGPTSSARSSATSNPVAGSYFNFTIPEPTGVVGLVAPGALVAPRAREPARPGPRERQHDGRDRLREPAARRGHAHRGPRDLGRPRRSGQPRDRARKAELVPGPGRPRRRRRDRHLGRRARRPGRGRDRPPPTASSGSPDGRAASPTSGSTGPTTGPPSDRSGSPPSSR